MWQIGSMAMAQTSAGDLLHSTGERHRDEKGWRTSASRVQLPRCRDARPLVGQVKKCVPGPFTALLSWEGDRRRRRLPQAPAGSAPFGSSAENARPPQGSGKRYLQNEAPRIDTSTWRCWYPSATREPIG